MKQFSRNVDIIDIDKTQTPMESFLVTKGMKYQRVPRVWFLKVVAQGKMPRHIDKSIMPRKVRMVLPAPGRMMVPRRAEKKSPWASLGAVIALTAYLVKFPEDLR
ncbi:hypothetical protein ATCVBr0604L_002L [Acanthocystis turfacea Chlorella virus Br0604L]|nr:hypothetical protein ATCVBr0604L_002L [Acanthocystis turfacea Chlorella virus Br0604L]